MAGWGRGVFVLLLAAIAAGLFSGVAVADAVRVSATARADHGRIVFSWGQPVPYTADLKGQRLTVRFGRPIEASYRSVTRKLGKYVRRAGPGGDGRSVVFTLTGSFEIGHYDTGTSVVIEIYGEPAETPPPRPKKTEVEKPGFKQQEPDQTTAPKRDTSRPLAESKGVAPPASLPRLGVRTGDHPKYTRVVFDWSRKVDYGVAETALGVTVAFGRGARPDLRKINAAPPKYVKGVGAEMKGKRLTVNFRTLPGVRVKHFLSGSKVVLDLLPPTPESIAKAKRRGETEKVAVQEAVSETEAPASEARPAGKPAELVDPGRPKALVPPKKLAEDAPQAPPVAPGTRPAPPPAPVAPVEKAAPPADISTISLRFDWTEPVAAAVFRRGGALWIAFDKAVSLDSAIVQRAAGNAVRRVTQVPSDDGTILRMETIEGVNPSLRRQGLAWILDLARQKISPVTPIETKAQPNSPIGARIFLPVPEPGKVLVVTDPEVGDNLVIVPVIPLGHGVDRNYTYPQVQVLPTGQGIVLRSWIDSLRVRPLRHGVEITAEEALRISSVSAQAVASSRLKAARPLTKIFELEKWRRGTVRTFNKDRRGFRNAVVRARGSLERENRRLDLARFLFASGYAAEALGVLKVIEDTRPEISGEQEFLALRGGSNFLMDRFEKAHEDLNHENLQKNDEAIFWRMAANAVMGDLFGAAKELKRISPIIRSYPKALKLPLGLLVAEAAIETGDFKKAEQILEIVKLENPDTREQAQLGYVEGRLKELAGDFDGAVGMWEKVMKSNHRPSQVKAAVARGELLYKLEKISRAELIKELEKLRFAWRGDEFEYALLRRMGTLYLEGKGYRDGLRTLKQAATHFRSHPDAPTITQQMADTFAFLYLDGGADALSPVTAIALYDEFKELTPVGKRGDKMIRKLADRLVSVDLLDRAAMLLDAQVKFRLVGVEKARVGAQLALVYLLNRESDKAMASLDVSEFKNASPELADQRRHIKARILGQMKRYEDSLTLLKSDKSLGADLLRAETFWEMRDWSNAAQAMRRLVRAFKAEPGEALDEKQARYVLNLAVALTLAGNDQGIDRLRQDYGRAMDAGPFREAFRLIARPKTEGLVDYATISRRVAEAENFQAFMATYRQQLKDGKLSAIN